MDIYVYIINLFCIAKKIGYTIDEFLFIFRLVFFQIQLIIEIIVIKKVSININRRGNNIKIKI
jgi:hypothetical protein